MQWYYSANGQQRGPVSDADLGALVRAGTVTTETLVWREGMTNWAAYSTVASSLVSIPSLPETAIAVGDAGRCAECGQTFATENLVKIQNAYICGNCKVGFLQRRQQGLTTGVGGIYQHRQRLVTPLNSALPARCVKCNAPTQTSPSKRKLQWHHPAVYFSLFGGILIYVIVALIARKTTTVMVSICPEHRTQRRNTILIGWLLAVLGIGSIFVGIAKDSPWGAIAGAVLILGGIIYGLAKGRLVYATKIDKERVWLNGCGKDFLAEFPEWTRG